MNLLNFELFLNMQKYVEENFSEPLVYFLECQFNVDVVPNYEEIKRIRTDSTFFPNVDRNAFRKNLVETIIENKLTPNIYEHLTNHELEIAYKEHRKTVQIHHVVPDEVVQTSELFKEARKKGIYNLDRIENQRALPNKDNLKPDDVFGHWGSHKGYTDEVKFEIKKVEDELKLKYKTLDKVPTKVLKRKIEDLENEFQRRLKDANVPIKNRRLSYLPSNQIIGGRNDVRV